MVMRSFTRAGAKLRQLTLLGLIVALAAIEFRSYAFASAFRIEHPFPVTKGRVVPDVLTVSAFQHRTPVRFVVEFEIGYLLLHRFFTYPVLVRRDDAGFHQR